MISKRGVSEGAISFFIYLAYFLMFMMFYLLMSSSDALKEVMIEGEGRTVRANDFLLSALRTDVVVEGEQMDLADLIGKATIDESYRRVVRSEIRKVIMPTDADPALGNNERYELMVSFPVGVPYKNKRTVDSDYSKWVRHNHEGSYYVGKFAPSDRMRVAEMILPNPDGQLINVTLYVDEDPGEELDYTIKDMMLYGLYPGEMLEDNNGKKIVAWDIGGRVLLSVDGAPCVSAYASIDGDDAAVCKSDGLIPPKDDDMLALSMYFSGNEVPDPSGDDPSDPDSPEPSDPPVNIYNFLHDQEPASTFTLRYGSHQVEWVAWGRIIYNDPTLYFAKVADSEKICPNGVKRFENFVFCTDSNRVNLNTNYVIMNNLDSFKTDLQLKDEGYLP